MATACETETSREKNKYVPMFEFTLFSFWLSSLELRRSPGGGRSFFTLSSMCRGECKCIRAPPHVRYRPAPVLFPSGGGREGRGGGVCVMGISGGWENLRPPRINEHAKPSVSPRCIQEPPPPPHTLQPKNKRHLRSRGPLLTPPPLLLPPPTSSPDFLQSSRIEERRSPSIRAAVYVVTAHCGRRSSRSKSKWDFLSGVGGGGIERIYIQRNVCVGEEISGGIGLKLPPGGSGSAAPRRKCYGKL